jgi:hypothetical protein
MLAAEVIQFLQLRPQGRVLVALEDGVPGEYEVECAGVMPEISRFSELTQNHVYLRVRKVKSE